MPKGVCDFWIKAFVNHPLGEMITEKDRPILGYLLNVELDLHPEDKGDGFDLIFRFSENSYFDGTVIKKEMYKKDGHPVKTVSPEIKWKDGCNPTKKKQKKKKKGKKVTVETQCESFFNIFESINPDEKTENDKKKDDGESDGDFEEDEAAIKLQENFDVAEQIKDDLVPLALEYYLGVIENEEEDEEGEEDSDEDNEGAAKKKKKGKKGGKGDLPLGPDGKPQECKQ